MRLLLVRSLSALACGAVLLCLGALSAHAEQRVALVIGNGAYKFAPHLPNPAHDAEDVAAALRRTGFEVIPGIDLDQAAMQDATIRFARAARTADVALFYYSGHALQYDGVNYLVPIDTQLTDEADLRRLTRADEVLSDLRQARNLRILVLDACRDNPFADELKRSMALTRSVSIGRGLGRMDSPDGTIISYATQFGRTAADGNGRNSPYTTAFLKHIGDRNNIDTIFRRISADVYDSTGHAQLPELSLSFFGEFYLNGRPEVAVAPPAPPSPPPADPAAQAWDAVKDTTSVGVLEDFIRRYGDTIYATLARDRLETVKKSQIAVVAPPARPAVPPAAQPPLVSPVAPQPSPGPCASDAQTVSLAARAAGPLCASEEWSLKPKDTFKECTQCPEMVVVPPGRFTMGSPKNESGRFDDEGPQRTVTIGKSFAVGKFHVTVDQFAAFVAETHYDAGSRCTTLEDSKQGPREGRSWRNPGFAQAPTHPALCLSWDDAKAYVDWLTRKTGKDYRLLSEAEWEYAVRGRTEPGSYPRFWFGNDDKSICRYANSSDQRAREDNLGIKGWSFAPCDDGYAYTSPVGHYPPNGFGLYDMAGNAFQWMQDCSHDSYKDAPSDGSAWTTGDCNSRVIRGGSWSSDPRLLRAADRYRGPPDVRTYFIGLRVARTLDGTAEDFSHLFDNAVLLNLGPANRK